MRSYMRVCRAPFRFSLLAIAAVGRLCGRATNIVDWCTVHLPAPCGCGHGAQARARCLRDRLRDRVQR
jgi:hypothetical protein